MRDFLPIVAGVLLGIFIMLMILDYLIREAYHKGWNDSYHRMREIEEPYYKSTHGYISALEEQIENYERHIQLLNEKYEIEVRRNEE